MKSDRFALLPPFLIAAYSVIGLAAKNIDLVTFHEVLRPLSVSLLLAALLVSLSQLALRHRPKASIFSSFLLISMFFAFAGIQAFVEKFVPALSGTSARQTLASVAAAALCIGLAVAVFVLLRRTKRSLATLTQYLAILSLVLLGFPMLSIAQYITSKNSVQNGMNHWDSQIASECKVTPLVIAPNPAPDIYYIILDMYARPDVQKSSFGYDNTEFVNYLRKKGFYVATDSHSNYTRTLLSLASSLNSDYLANLDQDGSMDSNQKMLRRMIRNNRIVRILKQSGYNYVLMSSGWEVSADNDQADIVLPNDIITITEMERVLIKKSIFDIWWKDSVPYLRPYVKHCFEDMAKLPQTKGPKFTFAHFVCPHEPWLFDKNGNEPTNPATPEMPMAWRKNYTDQVHYVNVMVKRLIDRILATSETPPIIIIQGDHGAFEPEFYTRWWKTNTLSNDEIAKGFRPRVSILNAYYFPGKGRKALYPSISPVNSFRVMLNQYFGGHYKMLEDASYIPKNGQSRNEMSPKDLRKIMW